ncbi:MAG TPA: histidine kinase dimerization/phospho-acceptor domain-containing protein [Polyangiales bacterium]|nr:histidine kinase dimerization/phospho-acceptor domain-containing protein [Polyangiales bacterium]
MKLGTLLFAAFVASLVLCFAYPVYVIANNLRLVYLESAEEPLVDTANVLAELAGAALERGALDIDALYGVSNRASARDANALIYEVLKSNVDLGVYMTDARGTVIFDSRGRESIGADYSQWRDVARTLSGSYGARVGSNPKDRSLPRLLYVAAPIRVRGELAGSLTVIKPTTGVNAFLHKLRPRLFALAAIALGTCIALALVMSLWVTQQVGRLTRYADQVREGKRVPFPKLAPTELRRMGLAFEKMRESLAGQTYIEQYVRALTHEIKSPISAIRGAAEILESSTLSPEQRARFLGNVRDETHRIQDLVDRMLELSELEVRRAPEARARATRSRAPDHPRGAGADLVAAPAALRARAAGGVGRAGRRLSTAPRLVQPAEERDRVQPCGRRDPRARAARCGFRAHRHRGSGPWHSGVCQGAHLRAFLFARAAGHRAQEHGTRLELRERDRGAPPRQRTARESAGARLASQLRDRSRLTWYVSKHGFSCLRAIR